MNANKGGQRLGGESVRFRRCSTYRQKEWFFADFADVV